MHAISLSDDISSNITLPASRTLTKEKEKNIKAEINIPSKTLELATRLLDLKKQKRSLDKLIHKVEKELGDIFDSQSIDCMEIEIGMLTRKKNDKDTEWFIEI